MAVQLLGDGSEEGVSLRGPFYVPQETGWVLTKHIPTVCRQQRVQEGVVWS